MKLQKPETPLPCRAVRTASRWLHIPDAEVRRRHRETYDQVKHLHPVCWQPEQIQTRIREAIRSRGPRLMALRTDLQDCFGSIPQQEVRHRIETLPLPPPLKQAVSDVLQLVPRGLPVGSPLSPWLAELVLSDIDAAMTGYPHYFRYVDDICVLGSVEECAAARHHLEAAVSRLGMRLRPDKTGLLAAEELVFLGRSYRTPDEARLLEVDLSGETLRLPNRKPMKLLVNRTGRPYEEQAGQIIYSRSCFLNRLSRQPTPYLLELLMLRPACEDELIHRIIQHSEWILDRGLPPALHGKIYRHYLTQVKSRAFGCGPLPIGAAGEVFRWLHLTNHLMRQGRLPESYQAVEAEWAQLLQELEAGQYESYHQRIKTLFKQEYHLRTQSAAGETLLPAQKPGFTLDWD